jgi:hypothetical protein
MLDLQLDNLVEIYAGTRTVADYNIAAHSYYIPFANYAGELLSKRIQSQHWRQQYQAAMAATQIPLTLDFQLVLNT